MDGRAWNWYARIWPVTGPGPAAKTTDERFSCLVRGEESAGGGESGKYDDPDALVQAPEEIP